MPEFLIIKSSFLTLSGPGGGSEARMTKLTAANQKSAANQNLFYDPQT